MTMTKPIPEKILSDQFQKSLLQTLHARFLRNTHRHKSISWEQVLARLETNPQKLWSLYQMEQTGGEPDVVGKEEDTGELLFSDCSAESPKERRSLCYDSEGIIYDPEDNGIPLESMGVYERWNNSIDKQYAKELGLGQGIDFVKLLYPDGFPQDPVNIDYFTEPTFSAYPNPFQSGFNIHFNTNSSTNTIIQLHNSTGRLVYQTTKELNSDDRFFIDAQHLENGLFYLTVIQNKKRSAITIIKTR